MFTGGAENDFFSFARLTRPSGPGLLRVLSGFVVVGWVLLKGIGQTMVELAKLLVRCLAHPRRAGRRWQWTKIKVGLSVWVRQFFTAAVARDLYDGVPAIYVNYLDYDVAAHAFGPQDRAAFRSLEFVDRSIRQICRILRRVPEHQYDFFILSDHGQAQSTAVRGADGRQAARAPALRRASGSRRHLDATSGSEGRGTPGSPMASWPTRSGGRGWANASCTSSTGSSRGPSTSGRRTSAAVFG